MWHWLSQWSSSSLCCSRVVPKIGVAPTWVFEADLKLEQLNWNVKYVCSSKHEAECYILIFSFEPCSRTASRSSTAQKSCGPLEDCCLIVLPHSSAVVLLVTWQGPSRIKFTWVKWVTLFSLLFSSWKTFEKIPLMLDIMSQKLCISLLTMPVSWEIPSLWEMLNFTQALTTLGFLLLVSVDLCFANWQNPCRFLLTSCKFTHSIDIGAPHLRCAVEISLCPVYSC